MIETKNRISIKTDNFVCPYCHSSLTVGQGSLFCLSCQKEYVVREGVADFREGSGYWCNVSPEKMLNLNTKASQIGDWHKAAQDIIPEYLDHIDRFDRADAQFLWPIYSNSRVLDAGSMWGGISVPLSQCCKEVVALDKTIETLQFLNIRCRQQKISNVIPVASTLKNMPFEDNYFDCVILNGVLEWVGVDDEIILEKHWGKRRDKNLRYKKTPYQMQLEVLREIRRVLKQNGCLCLAIENRFGYPYFIGRPDDHINVRFVSLMPRFLANIVTKLKINTEYRTYIYSARALRNLLLEVGFNSTEFYAVFPHYIMPNFVMPLSWAGKWFTRVVNPPQRYKKIILLSLPSKWRGFFVPSFMVLSSQDYSINPPHIVKAIKETGVIKSNIKDIKVVKWGGRPGNYLTTNFMVYLDGSTHPFLYCKVCRDKTHIDILRDESRNLEIAHRILGNSPLARSLPEVLFFGEVDGIVLLLTKYKSGETEDFIIERHLSLSVITKKISPLIDKSIEYLVKFQDMTNTGHIDAKVYLRSISQKTRDVIGANDEDILTSLDIFDSEVANMRNFTLSSCAVHGDFGLSNIKIINSNVHVFDWEHFLSEDSPIFDLSNLLLNILLVNEDFKENKSPARDVLDDAYAKRFIREKLSYYSQLSGMPKDILSLIGPICVLEHRIRDFPYYRNPDTYPLRRPDVFASLLKWRIDL